MAKQMISFFKANEKFFADLNNAKLDSSSQDSIMLSNLANKLIGLVISNLRGDLSFLKSLIKEDNKGYYGYISAKLELEKKFNYGTIFALIMAHYLAEHYDEFMKQIQSKYAILEEEKINEPFILSLYNICIAKVDAKIKAQLSIHLLEEIENENYLEYLQVIKSLGVLHLILSQQTLNISSLESMMDSISKALSIKAVINVENKILEYTGGMDHSIYVIKSYSEFILLFNKEQCGKEKVNWTQFLNKDILDIITFFKLGKLTDVGENKVSDFENGIAELNFLTSDETYDQYIAKVVANDSNPIIYNADTIIQFDLKNACIPCIADQTKKRSNKKGSVQYI